MTMSMRNAGYGGTTTSTVSSKTFQFSSIPRALDGRPKYRDSNNGSSPTRQQQQQEPGTTTGSNMVYDYRVRRESIIPLLRGTEKLTLPSLATIAARRKRGDFSATGTMSGTSNTAANNADMPNGPAAVDGRQHMDVQTESYLEEIAEKPKELTVETQTDAFMDRPPSPLFVPKKTGNDVETQIEPGELFDFDLEVEPILEVIVGKTLDQALTELVEEEELRSLRERQVEFERKRTAELAEVQRLEEAERRRVEEKERRLAQERARAEQQKKARAEAEIREAAKSYVAELTKSVFGDMKRKGCFYDKVENEVQSQFMPWLNTAVAAQLNQTTVTRNVLAALISHSLSRAAARYVAQ